MIGSSTAHTQNTEKQNAKNDGVFLALHLQQQSPQRSSFEQCTIDCTPPTSPKGGRLLNRRDIRRCWKQLVAAWGGLRELPAANADRSAARELAERQQQCGGFSHESAQSGCVSKR